MFKLVVLSALIACGATAPSLHHGPEQYSYAGPVATYGSAAPVLVQEYQHHGPAYAKVAEIVESVPSSVSHHSSAVVHNSAAVATPVITPVAKATIVSAPAPILHAAPIRTIVEATPIVEELHEAQYVAPIVKQVQLQPQAYAKVGEFVEHVPSSVSHHSSSVVHSSAAVATPVITPVAKATIVSAPAPIVHAAPIVEAAPIVQEVHEAQYVAPIVKQVQLQPQAYAKVGEFVEHVPSSVSHHSSSVVHNSAAVATPVITPVTKTIVQTNPIYKAAPLLKTVHAPAAYAVHDAPATYAVHNAPLYNALPYAAYNYGPSYHNEPLLRSW